ncbi:N(4)-(Beta-N-acetylglucosaminyl)-L-asparaginase [Stomoxys calcitrans]|uniref:N(4)-(Beta-N-acetylglucosaminyl)-L-asparaginase n=1 Tax=Stomoxys calcitrans TaxID=35570 RepID=UPI0027E3169C|nr:N(4)-(Beta-N-acetylglucosaminyl)-L-asparaginase [Stomoxys calcitrans]
MFQTYTHLRVMLWKLVFLILSHSVVSKHTTLPLVINTWAFKEANEAAWNTLMTGASALDSLVEGCSTCETLQCDFTVGYGGSPDENGETTLDAMIMDGSNMNIGAVAGMKEIKSASKVARMVLEHTKHTMLVGDEASNFAEMMGFQRESLTTEKSKEMWREWRDNECQPNFWLNVLPDPAKHCGPYRPLKERDLFEKNSYYSYKVDQWNHDTIGMIVISTEGHIFAGTSTNGAKHKIPGRVGDSPLPGAGAYADNEVGAAVATGDGDVMMRFLPSFLAVESLRNGLTPQEAAAKSMIRIAKFYSSFSGGLVVADKEGNFAAACVGLENFPYTVAFGDTNTTVLHQECIKEIGNKNEL